MRKIFVIMTVVMCLCFPMHINAYDVSEANLSMIDCIKHGENCIDTMQITKNNVNVNDTYKAIIENFYNNHDYDGINNYLKNNGLELSFVEPMNAIEGKRYCKTFHRSGTKTITLIDGSKRNIPLSWDLIVTCNYSVNNNTGKISSVSPPSISLENTIVWSDTQELHLVAHSTSARKIDNDTHIALNINYSIKTKYYYYPFNDITYGPYTITDTILN